MASSVTSHFNASKVDQVIEEVSRREEAMMTQISFEEFFLQE
jgi:hypothetical protein